MKRTESQRSYRFHQGKFFRLAAVALAVLTVILLFASLALSHLYVNALTRSACPDSGRRPEQFELPQEIDDVSFTTSDGLALSGWYLPGDNGATIILLGGKGTRGGMLPEAEILARHGYGLLLFDWRGCGESQESLHTLGYKEALDVVAAADFLSDQADTSQIGALGFSLGGVAAIGGAALHQGIGAVVAMGNYHDLEAEIFGAGDEHPVLTFILEHQIAWLFQRQTSVNFAQQPEPIDLIQDISPRPVLLIYGETEEALSPASGLALYRAAGDPKELWILPNVGHGGYLPAQPEEFEQRVVSFFDTALLH